MGGSTILERAALSAVRTEFNPDNPEHRAMAKDIIEGKASAVCFYGDPRFLSTRDAIIHKLALWAVSQ